jgi:hypothetical protein
MRLAAFGVKRAALWIATTLAAIALDPVHPAAWAAKLGGAYFVDDAEIGKLGSCEVESWVSSAQNSDRIAVVSPACVVNVGRPVELGTNLVNNRMDGTTNNTVSLTAKTVPLPIGPAKFGAAVAGAVVYDLTDGRVDGAILNVPITYDVSKQLRFNLNLGAQYSVGNGGLFALAGAGVAWNFVEQWSIISELFAIVGPSQTNPRFQSGIRFSPTNRIDWDVIYGRNINGNGANWITLGLTFRTGPQ